MNNKMVLAILSVYAFILCGVLGFQLIQNRAIVSAPSNSDEVAVEDRLDSAVVIYENSPVMLVNKAQMLINKNDAAMVPIIENQTVYAPISFFQTAYNAAASEDLSSCSATIRLDNQALILDRKTADLVDSSKEKDIEYNNKVFIKNGCIYVPIEVFADAFDKYVYYYDNMAIISGLKNSFTDTESTDFINSLKSQVNDLPFVANEENMKEISKVGTPNNILKQISSNNDKENTAIAPVNLLENKECETIETANGYIYYGNGNTVYILAENGDNLSTVSTITLDNDFHSEKLYLYNNSLIIAGNKENTLPTNSSDETIFTHSSIICVYDITDKTNAVKIKEVEIEGYYENSVQNSDFIYVLTHTPISDLVNNGHYYPPSYRDTSIGQEAQQLAYEQMQYFPEGICSSYMTVSSINLSDFTVPSEVKTYLGAGENVYMSNNNIYIAKSRYNAFDSNENVENTFIYRLGLLNGKIYTSGKGNVKGYIPDKNSMNEYSGYFRLAAQYKKRGINKNITNVYVLNNNLEICGYANEIVAGVEIDTAIFSKNMLFLTPIQTGQSIYSVDLTEPTNPRGNGVIKISNGNLLIYPYNENHIMTVDNGSNKLCINLYDISDKDNPIMLYSQELGRGNIETSMFDDISSFYFDREKNVFTIPVTIYENEEKQNVTFNGGYVFRVDLDDGFERVGSLTLPNSDAVIRSIKYNGNIYTFMLNTAVVADYDDLENIREYVLE